MTSDLNQSNPIAVSAVFDIGKSNKKLLLFDKHYSIVHQAQTVLDQSVDDDGEPCEDIGRLIEWVRLAFERALQNNEYRVVSLNFSAYGASLVHLDEKGEVVAPVYDYLKPYPEELLQQFYEQYGGRETFSLQTASPPMGMLNSGLQLYWLKYRKPSLFSKIRHSLHLPQYLSSLFTGEYVSERTSIGCHTGMWDFEQDSYHPWLKQEGLLQLLPGIQPAGRTRKVLHYGSTFRAGMGIHDSSAALASFQSVLDRPFLLVSTGTWSITMNPFNTRLLTFEELQKDCLCYMNTTGEQVKAGRFLLGGEFDHQKKKLERFFSGDAVDEPLQQVPDLLKTLIGQNSPEKKLQLEKAWSTGPWPQGKPSRWVLEDFSSYEEAYHQLMLDLVSIQADSIRLVLGSNENVQGSSGHIQGSGKLSPGSVGHAPGSGERVQDFKELLPGSGECDPNPDQHMPGSGERTRGSGEHPPVSRHIDTIVVTGGFSRNTFFLRLLASCFPEKKVFSTNLPEASALGAALVVEEKTGGVIGLKDRLNLKACNPIEGTGIEHYSWNLPE